MFDDNDKILLPNPRERTGTTTAKTNKSMRSGPTPSEGSNGSQIDRVQKPNEYNLPQGKFVPREEYMRKVYGESMMPDVPAKKRKR